jgi:hypothetical protein
MCDEGRLKKVVGEGREAAVVVVVARASVRRCTVRGLGSEVGRGEEGEGLWRDPRERAMRERLSAMWWESTSGGAAVDRGWWSAEAGKGGCVAGQGIAWTADRLGGWGQEKDWLA